MPKKKEKKKLEGKLETKVLDSGKSKKSAKFKKYKFWLEWEGRTLYYKDVIWKKIDLAQTVGWDVSQGEQPRSRRAPRQEEEKRIITLRVWSKRRKKAIDRKLMIPLSDFDTWLYWLLVSIQKHSDISILEEKLEGVQLKPGRKRKIRARGDMKAFDTLHEVFIAASEGVENMNMVSQKRHVISDPLTGKKKIGFTGEGGLRFGKRGKHLGSGGQADVYELTRIFPSPKRGSRTRDKIEPAVIKTPNTPGLDTLEAKGLITEARVLAALGEHPNIIRLIDAVITNNNIYVFMEKGEGDLKDFILSRVKARKRLSPIQINIIALGILAGVSHMHKRRIYHFDIKPANTLMFKNYRPKIMDFGLARTKLLYPGKEIYDIDVANEGTHGYIPPEGYVYPTPLSKGVDLEKYDSFAVGITILRWLIGPRYGWPDKEKPGRYVEKNVVEISKYWSKKYEDNRKTLDRDGLVMVGTVGWMMIQEDPMHRVTVLDAFESLKGALKERKSGRVALDVFKKWGK